MKGLLIILSVSLLAAYRGGGGGSSSCFVAAFVAAPPIISTPPTPLQRRRQQFSSSSSSSTRPTTTLHAEQQPNNALLSDLKNLQSKASDFVANSFNDESAKSTTTSSMMMAKDELSGMNNSSGSKMLLAKRTTAPPLKVTPPPPFDPTNPEALIAITKSFIATDFGIQTSQLPNYSTAPKKKKDEADTPLLKAINTVDSSSPLLSTTTTATNTDTTKPILPFYSSSLLSDTNFIWVSGNNINDGRTGILNKKEYLAAGRYFDLRSSFPDLEYRAHDFRVVVDEEGGYSSSSSSSSSSDGGGDRITVRFTTLVTGTFRGSSLKLRSKLMEPNGKVMNCPPTSVSITFATAGPEKGKIVKLVTDMVMDRQIGNTQGYSGIAGAAVIAGEEPNDFTSQPPLLVLGRIFSGKLTYLDERYGEEYLPPFPDTVMIQLAKGVVASNFGLDDPDLLANEFSYLEPSMGPLNKMKYLEKFSEYGVRDAVRDMDYRIMNYRVDQYNPYRIWVDTCARGTRTGPIGDKLPNVPAANYEAPPEAMSFSFDDDGYCTRITAAAVLDPLLGNTGGLGGVNGLLYATGTPQSALKTRSLNHFLTRATKSLFSKVGLSAGADSFKMSDGRVVSGMLPYGTNGVSVGLPSTVAVSTPKPPRPPAAVLAKPKPVAPFFAAPIIDNKPPQQPKAVRPAAPTKKIQTAQIIKEPAATAKPPAKEKAPIDANPQDPVTEALSNAFGITDAQVIASSTNSESTSVNKAQELRDKAREARAEAAEAMERAAALKAQAEEEKKKMLEAKLEEQQRRLQQIEEEQKMVLEAKEAKEKEKERIQQIAEETKMKKMQMKKKAEDVSTKKKSDDEGGSPAGTMFSFLSSPPSSSKVSLKGKETTPKKSSSPKLSPTLNLFNTSSGSSKSASAKPSTKPKSQTPKSSPTLNIFSSAPKVSSSTTVKKPSPTAPSSRSPTLSLMGVGAPPKSNVVKAASKKKAPKKKSLAKNKAPVPKPSPANQSPTLSFLGIGAASTESKAASEKSSAAKLPTKKSPTLTLFGVGGGEAATDESSAAKVPAKKSPTLSVFGVGGSSQSPSSAKQTSKSSTATAAKQPTSNNTFSFFGGGNQVTSGMKTKTISTAPKKLSKSDQQEPKKVEARKGTSNNVFGGFFGSSNSGNIKEEESSSVKNRKSVVKKAPKGVSVLKGWKANANNEIQGNVYSSASFRDGEKITTSPVKGRLQSGSLVISKSGSKYWLE